MKRMFITSGFGNNIFQKIWLENHKNVKCITLLERPNFINTFITKFSIHSDIIGFNDHTVKPIFIDYLMLMVLFIKKKISNKDFVSVRIFNSEWHFGYYQNNFIMNKSSERIYSEISNRINLELQPIKGDYGVLHIRRGDFDDKAINFDYYFKAMQHLIDLNLLPNTMVIVGPINNEEVKQLKESFSCNFIIENRSELEDLRILHNAKVAIGSNSTFAFWPLCLGKSKTVIFPTELKTNLRNLQDCKTQGSLYII